jgi:addiction module HigA family antidote
MLPDHNRIKGVHPGAVLKRELKSRSLKAVDLARSVEEHPQTINAITKERRRISAKLSIKLGQYFGVEKDYFSLLQASYDVKKEQHKSNSSVLLSKVRSHLFWDIDISKLDDQKHRKFIIQRILERGNGEEVEELMQFYGKAFITGLLPTITNVFGSGYSENVAKYIVCD